MRCGTVSSTAEFWTTVSRTACKIPKESFESMCREFEYFSLSHLQISGKDLITSQLTFFLYVRLAVFLRDTSPGVCVSTIT